MTTFDSGFGPTGDGKFKLLSGARTREILNDFAARAENRFCRSVLPIVGAKRNGNHDPIGSCVLIEREGVPYLVTAAHVLKHNSDTSLYVGTDKPHLIEAEFTVGRETDGNQGADRIDLAVARLDAEMAGRIGRDRFISRAEISVSVAPIEGRFFTCLGYPISQNKGFDPSTNVIKSKLRNYTSVGVHDIGTLAAIGISSETHIAVDHGKFSRDQGNKALSFDMHGCSGGAIIDIGRLGDPEVAGGLSNPTPKLIAIVIEQYETHGIVFGTKLSAFLDQIVNA